MARYRWQFEPAFSRLHADDDLLWVVPFRVRYVLAICGQRFVGKTTAVSHLVEKHRFEHYSLSSTLRRMAAEAGVAEGDRVRLQDFGDTMRRQHSDPTWLARHTLREIRRDHLSHRASGPPARIVVGGFKRREELEVFRSIRQFHAIGLTCESRYDRANASGIAAYELYLDPGAKVDPEQIDRDLDHRDRVGVDGAGDERYGQAVDEVMASIPEKDQIANDGDVGALYGELSKRIRDLDLLYRRPRG
jgi:molybdopterin-guanine dinucleotide biosynthesis protein